VLEVTENGKHDYEEAEYYTSTDGRIHFDNAWKTFAEKICLGPRDVVVMLFHMIEDIVHINITEVA
jgi:hypothetical protein